MALDKNLGIVLNGIGTSTLINNNTKEIIRIVNSKNLEVNTSAQTGKAEGGDNLYPLLTFTTSLEGKISIDDATLSIKNTAAITGGTATTGAEAYEYEEILVADGSEQVRITANIDVTTAYASVKETNTALTKVAASGDVDAASKFHLSATGVLTVDASLVGKTIIVSYAHTDANGLSTLMLDNLVPGEYQLRHQLITNTQADGKRYKLDLIAYRVKANGAVSYSAKRGEAYVQKLDFELLTANRADHATLKYNITEYTG